MWELTSFEIARENREDRDSWMAKRLIIDGYKAQQQILSALQIGAAEIRSPQQLKALTETVRDMVDEIQDQIRSIERAKWLDDIDLCTPE